jgi:hypothetical protein
MVIEAQNPAARIGPTVFLDVVEADPLGVHVAARRQGVEHQAGAFELIAEVGRVEPQQLAARHRQLDLLFEDGQLVAGAAVQADLADPEHGRAVEKFGDEGDHLAGQGEVVGLLGVHTDVGVVADEVLGRAFGLEGGQVGEVVVEGLGVGAVVAGPEGGFAAGHGVHEGHAFVVCRGAGDHVNVRFDDSHCRGLPIWYEFPAANRDADNHRAFGPRCPRLRCRKIDNPTAGRRQQDRLRKAGPWKSRAETR